MAVNSLAVLAFALLISRSSACVFVYGDRDEAAKAAGGHYTYSYNGLDWVNDFPGCRGQKQSPVFLPSAREAATWSLLQPPPAKATFSYGQATNPVVLNNGHTLQVVLPTGFTSNVRIPVKGNTNTALSTSIVLDDNALLNLNILFPNLNINYVTATPAQFHFHTRSEHVVSGIVYPLEMHIVHFIKSDQLPACGEPGCPVVLGVLLELTNDESKVSPALRQIVTAMPLNEGENTTIPASININSLLPSSRTYLTYEGSLTTPPCSEGILWHVLTTPMYISQSLFTRYLQAVGSSDCHPNSTLTDSIGPFQFPPADAEGCVKLADGQNYRDAQPLGARRILLST
ncbi:alpha carbonic anhydrase [Scenedesmus sp. NREL 46B-D3]|nr:alpha carbonic anhydrase [Scenedesmus sp. NREL 46B-D3]